VRRRAALVCFAALIATLAATLFVGARQTAPPAQQSPALPLPAPASLNFVVIDPAHGGTDAGARGSLGINESEIVLDFARALRAALESQGLRVIQTRNGPENPSFDDRSATANAQRGAVFITLHVSSTGTPGQVRVYSDPLPDSAPPQTAGQPPAPLVFPSRNALLSWDRAQEPYAAASRKLAEIVQASLAQKFPGSPGTPAFVPVRQLRTVGAPAIAIEVSSVSVASRDLLLQMSPGLADAIAQAVKSFRPIYAEAAR